MRELVSIKSQGYIYGGEILSEKILEKKETHIVQ